MKQCDVDGCGRKVLAKGLCQSHYLKGRDHVIKDQNKGRLQKLYWLLAASEHQGDECLEWPWGLDTYGYGQMGCVGLVHRYVAYEAIGEPPEGKDLVLHSCHNPKCCNPQHLRYGTQRENMQDMVAAGRQSRLKGEKNPNSKLTEDQVREIRDRLDGGDSCKLLSQEYGVTDSMIRSIKSKQHWIGV